MPGVGTSLPRGQGRLTVRSPVPVPLPCGTGLAARLPCFKGAGSGQLSRRRCFGELFGIYFPRCRASVTKHIPFTAESIVGQSWWLSRGCLGCSGAASDPVPGALPPWHEAAGRCLGSGFGVYGFLVFSAALLSNHLYQWHASAGEGGVGIRVQTSGASLCCFAFLARPGFL